MDQIKGTVVITAQNDTRFDELEIAFIGTLTFLPINIHSAQSPTKRLQARQELLSIAWPPQLQLAAERKPRRPF